jgi:hypothetical protein
MATAPSPIPNLAEGRRPARGHEAEDEDDPAGEDDGARAESIGQRTQTNAPAPMQRKLSSAAVAMPVRDHPIAWAMGCRTMLSEAIAPNPTHVTTIPAPTMTQP